MSNIQTYTKDIEVTPNHKYYHAKTGTVNSVTTILSGNINKSNIETPAMQKGTAIHNTLEAYYKKNTDLTKELFLTLGEEEQYKVREITKLVKSLGLLTKSPKGNYSELSFVANDNGVKFGGTADLVTNDFIVDFKTGDFDASKHLPQIASYANALGKKQAGIIYFKDGKVTNAFFDTDGLNDKYEYFKSKARTIGNQLTEFDAKMLEILNSFNSRKEQIAMLEAEAERDKLLALEALKEKEFTKYALDRFCVYEVKGRTTKTLVKEAKEELEISHPEYFKVNTGNPTYSIRIGE
ncbi:PD-(D/E)XK nuclease family protein [Rickettsiales bacterium LUAb2]